MANFLMPKRHVSTEEGSASRVAGEVSGVAAHSGARRERELTAGRGPVGDIAAGAAGVVIANPGDDSVSILDPATLTLSTYVTDGEPLAVVVTDDRAYVATTSQDRDAVSAIELGSGAVAATFPVASGISALAVSPDGKRVYAGRTEGGRVDIAVIDVPAERVGTIEVGSGPGANIDALRVNPTGKHLVAAVSDDDGSQLIIADTETMRVRRVVPVGAPIRDIAHAGSTVYVLTSDRAVGGAVHVLDLSTNTVTDTVVLGGAPTQLAMSADLARAYVVDYDRVVVLCTLSLEVLDSLTVDARPSCVASSADGSRLYIGDYAGAVTVFAVSSTIEEMYTQFLVTDPIVAAPRARELQPVTA